MAEDLAAAQASLEEMGQLQARLHDAENSLKKAEGQAVSLRDRLEELQSRHDAVLHSSAAGRQELQRLCTALDMVETAQQVRWPAVSSCCALQEQLLCLISLSLKCSETKTLGACWSRRR